MDPIRNILAIVHPRRLSSRHWVVLLIALSAILAFYGRSAAARDDRVEEMIEKALALKPDTWDGGQLYRRHCSSCHGRQAYGDASNAIPVLAGQVTSYLVKQLADLVEGYRQVPEMHRQVSRTEIATPQALHDLAAYLSSLSPLSEPQLGDGKQLLLGGRVYRSTCAECHGINGEGDSTTRTPALRGQH